MEATRYKSERPSLAYAASAANLRRSRYDPYGTVELTERTFETPGERLSTTQRDTTDFRMLNHIEREINDALYAFQVERDKQHGVLKAMRNELKYIKESPKISHYATQKPAVKASADSYKSMQGVRQENLTLVNKLNKYKAKTKALKRKLADEKAERDSLLEELEKYKAGTEAAVKENIEMRNVLKELDDVKGKLRASQNELNNKVIENKMLQRDMDLLRMQSTGNEKGKLIEILQQGALEYDYLKSMDYTKETMDTLLDEVYRLVEYLMREKKDSEVKYGKLLELHNKLIETTGKGSGRYSEEYIYGLADDNDKMKQELENIRATKLNLEAENERLKTQLDITEKKPEAEPVWANTTSEVQTKISELERKIKALETKHGSGKKAKTTKAKTGKPAIQRKKQ